MSDDKTTISIVGAIVIALGKFFHIRSSSGKVAVLAERIKKLEEIEPVGPDTVRVQVSAVADSVSSLERSVRRDVARVERAVELHVKASNDNFGRVMYELSELKTLMIEDARRRGGNR